MKPQGYTYTFRALNTSLSSVSVVNHQTNERSHFRMGVNDSQLLYASSHQIPSFLADWVDVAAAVAVADRLSLRKADMPCNIHIRLPIRQPDNFSTVPVSKSLQQVLFWYTGDFWTFDFLPRTGYGRQAELQVSFSGAAHQDQPVEVSLWSGGLDSLAGVYHVLWQGSAAHHILFGTGLNAIIHSKQRQVAEALRKVYPGRTTLIQVFIRLDSTNATQKNQLQRARGFFFLLLGAVCALLEGQDSLAIYENGVGAINLPYRDSEVGLDHSRSVHPVSMIRMGELVSHLLGRPFTFRNPFLFQTKAQMCTALATTAPELVVQSFTCDRPHRKHPMQCGYCSSCLLRKQALAALNIQDPTSYLVTSPLNSLDSHPQRGAYLQVMLHQVASLQDCLTAPDPWIALSRQYPALSEIVDEMVKLEQEPQALLIEQLLHLYQQYVLEWERLLPIAS